jgi:hypothetical protein
MGGSSTLGGGLLGNPTGQDDDDDEDSDANAEKKIIAGEGIVQPL